MAQPQIKLTYFDVKGRAELARMLFAYGGIPFVDERISHDDFAKLKPSLPLGQLPVLEVDGVTYSQSMAIAIYAAQLAGLYPTDAVKTLKIGMISATLTELEGPYVDIMYLTTDEAEKAEKTKKFLEVTVPKAFGAIEKLVEGKFILGDQLSYADVQLYDMVENKIKPAFSTFSLEAYPQVAAILKNVATDEKIAAYLSKP